MRRCFGLVNHETGIRARRVIPRTQLVTQRQQLTLESKFETGHFGSRPLAATGCAVRLQKILKGS